MENKEISELIQMFKPERCVFVVSADKNNKASGMIAAWYTRCSSNPPLIAVSLSKKGHTQKLIHQSKEFVVAVPNKGIEKELLFFGSKHGHEVNKFKETGLETENAKMIKVPIIKEATLNFECKLHKEVDAGDHIMFIGEVVAAHHNKEKKVLLVMGKDKEGNRTYEEF
jgi:flavin reductase (DIM6/NTAB) family NADH-FMN oxidoreductase RutF